VADPEQIEFRREAVCDAARAYREGYEQALPGDELDILWLDLTDALDELAQAEFSG
jgi:hypothetical protein